MNFRRTLVWFLAGLLFWCSRPLALIQAFDTTRSASPYNKVSLMFDMLLGAILVVEASREESDLKIFGSRWRRCNDYKRVNSCYILILFHWFAGAAAGSSGSSIWSFVSKGILTKVLKDVWQVGAESAGYFFAFGMASSRSGWVSGSPSWASILTCARLDNRCLDIPF